MLPCASCGVVFVLSVKLFTTVILGRDTAYPRSKEKIDLYVCLLTVGV
jgi:hypothetical protein